MPTAAEISEVLDEGREEMAGMFTDTCRITRTSRLGKGTWNEATGQYDDVPARVTIYEGPCRIQVKADINSNVVETTAGEREWTYLTAQLQLPVVVDTTDERYVSGSPSHVTTDDTAVILTAPYAESSMIGALFNIQGSYHKTHPVYLRYRVREVAA